MKSLIIVLCALSCAYAVDENAAEIVKNEYKLDPKGSYHYAVETNNGIFSQADAVVKPVNKDESTLEVQGSSQYQSPDGEIIKLTYIANENGYQPQGAHLPTQPPPMPIPDYILRALEYIRDHPYQEKKL